MNVFVRFLHFCAGVDGALLRRCPRHERSKYLRSGTLVLLTASFAFAGAGYAVFTVFERIETALFFGGLWALLILNLDSLLLATFPKCEAWYRQFMHAAPRLILAGFVGFTIAHPITVRLFQPEINEHLDGEATNKRNDSLNRRDETKRQAAREAVLNKSTVPEYAAVEQRKKERDDLMGQLQRCNSLAVTAQRDYVAEADGTGGSGRFGCGTICNKKKGVLDEQLRACSDLRKPIEGAKRALADAEQRLFLVAPPIDAELRKREERIDRAYMSDIASIASSQSRSFFARSEALETIGNRRPDAARMRWFVSIMFVVVEIMVVFTKIITPADSADRLAVATREAFKERIPAIASELAGHGNAVYPEPPELEPEYQTEEPAEPILGTGIRRRNILVILMTTAVMVVMQLLGRSVEEIEVAGTLVVGAAPLIAYYQRKHSKENHQ